MSRSETDVRPGGHVLVVAGADSSGGAGLCRDLETLGELGVRSAVAVTAVTVQTHAAVERIRYLEPDMVACQMQAAFRANAIAAIKIGMLGRAATVEAVANVLRDQAILPTVLDPVIASTSGTIFLDDQAMRLLKVTLMPLCSLITPNIVELALLCNEAEATSEQAMIEQARHLRSNGAGAVLVKGGHGRGPKAIDILVCKDDVPVRIETARIKASLRGTGCMLSSAIACYQAMGAQLDDACRLAKMLVSTKLSSVTPDFSFSP